ARVRAPVTIEQLARVPLILPDARWGAQAPMRRQLAARAQRAGVRVEPAIEVEAPHHALELAARGLGDTLVDERTTRRRGALPGALRTASFAEPIYETFAFISRRDVRLSPAARELVAL